MVTRSGVIAGILAGVIALAHPQDKQRPRPTADKEVRSDRGKAATDPGQLSREDREILANLEMLMHLELLLNLEKIQYLDLLDGRKDLPGSRDAAAREKESEKKKKP